MAEYSRLFSRVWPLEDLFVKVISCHDLYPSLAVLSRENVGEIQLGSCLVGSLMLMLTRQGNLSIIFTYLCITHII
jgi:hypothetical protein